MAGRGLLGTAPGGTKTKNESIMNENTKISKIGHTVSFQSNRCWFIVDKSYGNWSNKKINA
jgi:hypothetical protein